MDFRILAVGIGIRHALAVSGGCPGQRLVDLLGGVLVARPMTPWFDEPLAGIGIQHGLAVSGGCPGQCLVDFAFAFAFVTSRSTPALPLLPVGALPLEKQGTLASREVETVLRFVML